jgi:aminopeptidase YwaD
MTAHRIVRPLMSTAVLLVLLAGVPAAQAPQREPPPPPTMPKTPLSQGVLNLLADEISGQVMFNNEVRLAGAPWLRDMSEFSGTLYEAQRMYDLVRGYGIETTRIERSTTDRKVDYPMEGELWVTAPEKRLVARLDADTALVASGSSTADLSGELAYIPPGNEEQLKALLAGPPADRFKGKVVLMWNHVRDPLAKLLDGAGVAGVISFNSQDRYLDPDQVIYSGGSYKGANLKVGMTVSWRQWSEMLEDVQRGQKITVRMKTRVERVPDKFEAVYSWIPGTEPDAKGVIFTAHLFEGIVKRGANDDMSGCAVQLEILRALNKLIASGELPRPRRTIYFLWPFEISGTYEFIKRHPGFADKLSANFNMDMVGEALRKNNGVMTMSECPDHLPCYTDGLARSVMNYVWRTNDIVYLPDAPRGRPGGQFFPRPMVEKNGSDDAFRFFIHRATGGSDHICFNNPSVAVPGVELFTWPDQWYHADADTPDKSDPTQMKRIGFIGAALAWVGANATDGVVAPLADAVSEFGYSRVAERDLPRALAMVETADPAGLEAATDRALIVADFAVDREVGALRSIEGIYSGSPAARTAIDNKVQQWELYRAGLKAQVSGFAKLRQSQLVPTAAQSTQKKPVGRGSNPAVSGSGRTASAVSPAAKLIPALDPSVRGREFSLASFANYAKYIKENPDALKKLGLTPQQANTIGNYISGKRSVLKIRNCVVGETGRDVALDAVAGYIEMLKSVGWVVYGGRTN